MTSNKELLKEGNVSTGTLPSPPSAASSTLPFRRTQNQMIVSPLSQPRNAFLPPPPILSSALRCQCSAATIEECAASADAACVSSPAQAARRVISSLSPAKLAASWCLAQLLSAGPSYGEANKQEYRISTQRVATPRPNRDSFILSDRNSNDVE